jgi:hypothetical protein
MINLGTTRGQLGVNLRSTRNHPGVDRGHQPTPPYRGKVAVPTRHTHAIQQAPVAFQILRIQQILPLLLLKIILLIILPILLVPILLLMILVFLAVRSLRTRARTDIDHDLPIMTYQGD